MNIIEWCSREQWDKRLDCQCFHCQRAMKKQSIRNAPAFCSYECGANGQPDNAQRSVRNTTGGNVN